MLVFRERKFQRVLQRATAPTELRSWNDIFRVPNWLNLAPRKKVHKSILVFKCSNNLVPKHLTLYFTRNANLHDHATRGRNDLHPPKPNGNMGKITFKYAGTISVLYPIVLKVPRL